MVRSSVKLKYLNIRTNEEVKVMWTVETSLEFFNFTYISIFLWQTSQNDKMGDACSTHGRDYKMYTELSRSN
jgi:hypothetical protein